MNTSISEHNMCVEITPSAAYSELCGYFPRNFENLYILNQLQNFLSIIFQIFNTISPDFVMFRFF